MKLETRNLKLQASSLKLKQEGQIIIISAVLMLVVMILIVGLVGYAGVQIKSHRQAVGRVIGLNIAEAAVEKALWRLNNTSGYTGESNTTYGEGVYNVTVTNVTSTTKLIKADVFIPNATAPRAKRTVQLTVTKGSTNIGFNYGLQVGLGGLEMTNSTRVVGNVYSNGNIVGTNSASISGTVITAGTSSVTDMTVEEDIKSYRVQGNSAITGNANVDTLINSTVGGNVVADLIQSCTITGNATFDTRTSCSVGGTTTMPNPEEYEEEPVIPMPISEEIIDAWEEEATDGGEIGTQIYTSGTRNLGPKKINGNLILSNTAEVVVTGTLWVTGEIRLTNSAVLRLDPGYGTLSGVVMAGIDESTTTGYIEVDNFTQVLGSGTAGSYLMLLSQREGIGSTAIKQANGGDSAILYAGEGMIEISNEAEMKEITAEKLKITNNAEITYEIGLANANFSSGPGGGWEVLDGTWQLLQ